MSLQLKNGVPSHIFGNRHDLDRTTSGALDSLIFCPTVICPWFSHFQTFIDRWIMGKASINQWIGLRENLNRKPWFLPSNIGVSCRIFHHPVLWTNGGFSGKKTSINGGFSIAIFDYRRVPKAKDFTKSQGTGPWTHQKPVVILFCSPKKIEPLELITLPSGKQTKSYWKWS